MGTWRRPMGPRRTLPRRRRPRPLGRFIWLGTVGIRQLGTLQPVVDALRLAQRRVDFVVGRLCLPGLGLARMD